MYVFPESSLRSVHYDEVLQMLVSYCQTYYGKVTCERLEWYQEKNALEYAFRPVSETLNFLKCGNELPILECDDVDELLNHLKIPGWSIDEERLVRVRKLLHSIFQIKLFAKKLPPETVLKQLIDSIHWNNKILYRINEIIDEQGIVRDTASERLRVLRQEHYQIEKEIQILLHQILKKYKQESVLPEDVALTIRHGRMVIPVSASLRSRVKGIIHDQSATGQTIFVEPYEVVEAGNKLRDNELQQSSEIRKILFEVSDFLRQHYDVIEKYPTFLGQMDSIFARAIFARDYQCVVPIIDEQPLIDLKDARHPVLEKHLKKANKTIVPLSIHLSKEQQIMVLSGANAGGKTVVLKTVALLQCMVQQAIPVPCREDTVMGIFHSLFVDIGDNQSIENDLSTFSSHLQIVKRLLDAADDRTLFLFDEIGSATDPDLGSALARSVLLELLDRGSIGIVTTHFETLKQFASQTPGMHNASMAFDYDTLQPLYILRQHVPGQSFTFEIARRAQLSPVVLDRARQIAGQQRLKVEELIGQLEAKERQLKQQEEKIRAAEELFHEILEKYKNRLRLLEKEYKSIIGEAKQRAQKLLDESNKKIEETIRAIKESNAEREQTRQLRAELKKYRNDIDKIEEVSAFIRKIKIPEANEKQQSLQFKPGDMVSVGEEKIIGEVLELLDNGRVKVMTNSVVLDVSYDSLKPYTGQQQQKKQTLSSMLLQKKTDFQSRLDIRGLRAEEALTVVEKFIDDALVAGLTKVSILHGKGYGVLRQVVRQMLARHPYVEKFESAHIEQGGDGITIIQLKVLE